MVSKKEGKEILTKVSQDIKTKNKKEKLRNQIREETIRKIQESRTRELPEQITEEERMRIINSATSLGIDVQNKSITEIKESMKKALEK